MFEFFWSSEVLFFKGSPGVPGLPGATGRIGAPVSFSRHFKRVLEFHFYTFEGFSQNDVNAVFRDLLADQDLLALKDQRENE